MGRGDADERRQSPGPVHPIGERREGENDDEKRNVEEDRSEAVDQKVDQRRHRIEESGRVVLQPSDPDLNPASERNFRFGKPTLQRRPSNKDISEPSPSARRAEGEGPLRSRSLRLQAEALLDRVETRL